MLFLHYFLIHKIMNQGGKLLNLHGSLLTLESIAHRNGLAFHLTLSHNQHIGDFLQLGFPDLVSYLLIPEVRFHPDGPSLGLSKRFLDLKRIVVTLFADRNNERLNRGQPKRKGPPHNAQ